MKLKKNIMSTETITPVKPQSIVIIGRRWFQRTYGNTYNTAQIIVDGETVHKTPEEYGYGDHYLSIAADWLEKNGYLPGREHGQYVSPQPLWRYCQDHGIAYSAQAIDVTRERDL